MKLSSPAFGHNSNIPSKYTCDGKNINPPLTITNVPPSTKSLVLIMDDPDIPLFVKEKFNIQIWDHWIVFNIAPTTTEIKEDSLPGIAGKSTNGMNSYGGPCPPDGEHRYFFKLYALDTMLNLKAGATQREVEIAMSGHILERAELVGRYKKR